MWKKLILFFVLLGLVFSLTACKTENLPPDPAPPGADTSDLPVGQAYKASAEDAVFGEWEPSDPTGVFAIDSDVLFFAPGEVEPKYLLMTVKGEDYVYKEFYFSKDGKEWTIPPFEFAEVTVGSSKWISGNVQNSLKIDPADIGAGIKYLAAYSCKKADPMRKQWIPEDDCHGNEWMGHYFEVVVMPNDLDTDNEMCTGCGFNWMDTGYCCGDDPKEAFVTEETKSDCCEFSYYGVDPVTGKCLPPEPCPFDDESTLDVNENKKCLDSRVAIEQAELAAISNWKDICKFEEQIPVVDIGSEVICEAPLVKLEGKCCMDENNDGSCDGVSGAGTEVICQAPLVKIGEACCMDENNDGACDTA